jgi:hypothetical protein
VVFVGKGKMVAQTLVNKRVTAAVLWYNIELYMNAGPDSLGTLCCG